MEKSEFRPRKLDDIGMYIRSRSSLGLIVQDVLETKGSAVVTISPESTLQEAAEMMARDNIGALVVVESDKVVGIISERDFVREEVHGQRDPKKNTVRRLMSAPVQTVAPADSVAECMSLMTVGRVRHLPVCVNDRAVGIVSIGDLVNSYIQNKENLLRQYDRYIRGD
jgi:CBS domain-containing protein